MKRYIKGFGDFSINENHWNDLPSEEEFMSMRADSNAEHNRRDARGMTPLMSAVDRCDVDMVVSLLSRGADPNARDMRGMTALDYAEELADTRYGHVDPMEYDRGIDEIIILLRDASDEEDEENYEI